MTKLGSMMAGGDNNNRQVDDFYGTPIDVTQVLINTGFKPKIFWEPCAGNNKMVNVYLPFCEKIYRSDINPRAKNIKKLDFLQATKLPPNCFTIITNPPFNIADKVIKHAFSLGCKRLALVLKSTYWHAAGRQSLFNKHKPSHIYPLTWRPDFMELGRPTMEIMWCIWKTPCAEQTLYQPLIRPNR